MKTTTTLSAFAILALLFAFAAVAWRLSLDPWQGLAAEVHEQADPEALIVITPGMHNREARLFNGYAVIASDRLSSRDVRGFQEVWILSEGLPSTPILRGLKSYSSETILEDGDLVLLRYHRKEQGK